MKKFLVSLATVALAGAGFAAPAQADQFDAELVLWTTAQMRLMPCDAVTQQVKDIAGTAPVSASQLREKALVNVGVELNQLDPAMQKIYTAYTDALVARGRECGAVTGGGLGSLSSGSSGFNFGSS
ncbi:hypothetical protein [Corynebacterium pygosceleis]|uniref:Uncharacterized protein n=1 Tax=Corynebacterium pygosceleis TaxID=2800406 RepID=A0A9Q4GM60_9CORY|nr:hypothetical protein [Corynebacterium pygosceleis]MCK7638317.1 hypothetical protein [Corynebacterium pygosceleis]MCK7675297.1 hypothetical protein [Corynebacterium pygosceleis]MCL0121309.1 hypothetical protein [Corynebacterium pygosceleis]MCX7468980.1 hypothetical protein [Corynebacterium pygosceleis]